MTPVSLGAISNIDLLIPAQTHTMTWHMYMYIPGFPYYKFVCLF